MRIDGSTRQQTTIDDETGGILLRRLHPRIASYNDLVIFLMKSNMDIKFIGSGEAAKALLYYVTDYITKSSLPAQVGLAALSYAIQKTNEQFPCMVEDADGPRPKGALNVAVNRMMSQQEISHQQVMSYLIGGGDVYSSHKYRVLHWGSFDRLFRKAFAEVESAGYELSAPEGDVVESRPPEEDPASNMNSGHDGDEDSSGPGESCILRLEQGTVACMSQQQDYVYRSNDSPFGDLCLYEFVGKTEKATLKGNTTCKGLHRMLEGAMLFHEVLSRLLNTRNSRRMLYG
ncbi:hypothetical protein FKP32DRAFT_1672958 [Trametes sanguinea]|nr:hypothetical protein FKP32DRAFT_1672958 [Trametes sanguinea]